jgi:hypothetical protein
MISELRRRADRGKQSLSARRDVLDVAIGPEALGPRCSRARSVQLPMADIVAEQRWITAGTMQVTNDQQPRRSRGRTVCAVAPAPPRRSYPEAFCPGASSLSRML